MLQRSQPVPINREPVKIKLGLTHICWVYPKIFITSLVEKVEIMLLMVSICNDFEIFNTETRSMKPRRHETRSPETRSMKREA
jgi:hypothetical protein